MAEVPSWKRTLMEVMSNQKEENLPPSKRHRSSISQLSIPSDGGSTSAASPISAPDSVSKLLSQLDTGLSYVSSMSDLSDEAKMHAAELRKLLYKEASASFAKALKEGGDEKAPTKSASKHTAVPAPIPGVRAGSGSESPDSVSTNGWVLPPLPPITDLTLLNSPFVHANSLPNHVTATSTNSYEPLEFLGDAYLEVMATRLIHTRFPMYTVGQKAGLREILIKNETLAQYARDYGLNHRVQMAKNSKELLSPAKWTKILGDVFEAYVACIILSDDVNGMKTAEEWLGELWEPKVKEWLRVGDGKTNGIQESINHDVKGELQRYVVSKGVQLNYVEIRPMEFDRNNNRTTYHIGLYLTGWGYNKVKLGSGSGRSKQIAGSEAAKNAFAISKMVLDDAHQKKIKFDEYNAKRKAAMAAQLQLHP